MKIVSVHICFFSLCQVNIVLVHILYVSFMPIYIGQDGLSGTPVYVSIRQFMVVYINGQGHGACQLPIIQGVPK